LSSAKRIADQPGWLTRILQDHRRALTDAALRLRGHAFGTLLTAFVIGVTLALPAALNTVVRSFGAVGYSWEGAYQASLFLKPSVEQQRGQQLAAEISTRAGVIKARYISREQALAEFKAHSNYGAALDVLQDNPLPAVISVTPDRHLPREEADALLAALAKLPEVDEARLDQKWLDRLYSILAFVRQVVGVIAGLLALSVTVVIANTIRLDIENRREEIVVLKQVGATDGFIRRPLLYIGVGYGLLGSLVATVLVVGGLQLLTSPALQLLGLDSLPGSSLGLSGTELAVMFGVGMLIGWATTFWTVWRELRHIEPH
jgi:cell division transport system permease protein